MKVWSTTQVGARLAAALGKQVTDAFVRDCYLDMHGLEHMGCGHVIRITETEARLVLAYGLEWHGRPGAPKVVAWATEHRFEIPGLRKRLLPVRVAQSAQRPQATNPTPAIMATNVVAAEIEELKKRVAVLESDRRGAARPVRITDRASSVGSVIRNRLNRLVRSWVMQHGKRVPFAVAWSELYRQFFADIGEPIPEDWYRSQLANEVKLGYLEKHGWVGVFADAVPGFLVKMDEGLTVPAGPTSPTDQGELGI